MKKYLLLLPAVLLVPLLMAQDSNMGFVRIAVHEIEWTLRPSGTSFAILHGDPAAEGLYIQRNKFPANTFSNPHHHDQDRFVTVISGTWYTGIGPSGNRDDTVALPAGSYMKHPAGGVHYDGAIDEEVIVEIRGMGPVQTIPVNQ